MHLQEMYGEKLDRGSLRDGKGLAPSTVRNHIHAPLRRALKSAVRWNLIPTNPADAVEPPKVTQPDIKVWSADEVRTFLEHAHSQSTQTLYTIFLTAVTTGMRRGELLGLRWANIDFEHGTAAIRHSLVRDARGRLHMHEPKTKAGRRSVALSSMLLTALRRHRAGQAAQRLQLGQTYEDADLVFADERGRPLRPRSVTRKFKLLAEEAKVESIRFYDLRHTHATLMLTQGVHPKIVSERLGHSSVSITLDTYSHVLPNLQHAAAEALSEVLLGEERGGIASYQLLGPTEGPNLLEILLASRAGRIRGRPAAELTTLLLSGTLDQLGRWPFLTHHRTPELALPPFLDGL